MRIGATKDSKSEIKNFYSFYSFTFVPFLLHSIMSYLTVFLRHLLLPIKQAARFLKMFDPDYIFQGGQNTQSSETGFTWLIIIA